MDISPCEDLNPKYVGTITVNIFKVDGGLAINIPTLPELGIMYCDNNITLEQLDKQADNGVQEIFNKALAHLLGLTEYPTGL